MSVYDGLTIEMQPDLVAPNKGSDKMGKKLLRSKTFWINALTGVVSIGTYLVNTDFIASNPEIVAIFGVILAVVNIILRLVTKEPIKGI